MNKNVWIFNHYATDTFLDRGGRHYNFAKYLIMDNNSVKIFCSSTVHNSTKNFITDNKLYFEDICDKIPYIFIKARNYKGNGKQRILNMLDYFFRLFSVTKKIEKKYSKPDVIYTSSVHPLACVAGILIAKRYNIKCIVEIRDLWPLTLIELGKLEKRSIITYILYKLEHWIYKKADSIIFTMEGGKEYISDMGWSIEKGDYIDLAKVYHINNGVDLDIFNAQKDDYVFTDKDLNNNDTFKVIYTGSVSKANFVEYIIKSAKIIKEKGYNNIKYIIFGDGVFKGELQRFCIENDLENVIFKGKVEKKYIANILSKSDLNIFTGKKSDLYKYGLSVNKMFDYIASGKPIISNIECGYDILERYGCGITVESGNINAIVDGVLKFYNMPKTEYHQYCENALRASQEYDFKKLTDKLVKILNKCFN